MASPEKLATIYAALRVLSRVTRDDMIALYRQEGWDKLVIYDERDSVRNLVGKAIAHVAQPSLF